MHYSKKKTKLTPLIRITDGIAMRKNLQRCKKCRWAKVRDVFDYSLTYRNADTDGQSISSIFIVSGFRGMLEYEQII